MYATTRQFLDYFNLKSLDQLPTLSEIKDLSKLEPELDLDNTMSQVEEGTQPQADELSSDGPVEEQSDVIPENESVH
jgi:segregation and condensation protein B